MIETAEPRSQPLFALRSLEALIPARRRLVIVALLGALAAAFVGYLTAENPAAAPAHVGAVVRVLIITMLIAAGVYACTTKIHAPMGVLLIATGFYSALWLLNGSADELAFSIGVVSSGVAPTVFAYVMLAHPSGRLESRSERIFIGALGGALVLFWGLLILADPQPPFRTPLLRCVPHCPPNVFSVGTANVLLDVLKPVTWVTWAALACGTPLFLARRMRSASAPMRQALAPVAVVAAANALLWLGFFVARIAHIGSSGALGAAYIEVVVAIPLAILSGLALERLFMARELADLVNLIMQTPHADPQRLMAQALDDPSLKVAYQRPKHGTYVDSSGRSVALPDHDSDRSVAWIERGRVAVAAVVYDRKLADQERFIQAAGAAAMMRLEGVQLEADLMASTRELAASRARLVGVAHAERQRIERDLHDSVQQQLVGLRLKLDLAAEAVKQEPARGEQMIASIGRQMDDLLASLRSIARGIYPALLAEHGVLEAVRSSARRSPIPISVRARGISRYSKETEIAVYFCCLEAIQNVAKHAGPSTAATVRFWEADDSLWFDVSDSGVGFDQSAVNGANGLVNMRDRIEAVGGRLTVTSRNGQGTSVRGTVPI